MLQKIGLIHFYCNLHKGRVELFLAFNIILQMLLIKLSIIEYSYVLSVLLCMKQCGCM